MIIGKALTGRKVLCHNEVHEVSTFLSVTESNIVSSELEVGTPCHQSFKTEKGI